MLPTQHKKSVQPSRETQHDRADAEDEVSTGRQDKDANQDPDAATHTRRNITTAVRVVTFAITAELHQNFPSRGRQRMCSKALYPALDSVAESARTG